MAWRAPCFNNLIYQRSEICHHRNTTIFCAETDFDETDITEICGENYTAAAQGIYLNDNYTHPPLASKEHHFNVAVIQHLINWVDELEHQIRCLWLNSFCMRIERIFQD